MSSQIRTNITEGKRMLRRVDTKFFFQLFLVLMLVFSIFFFVRSNNSMLTNTNSKKAIDNYNPDSWIRSEIQTIKSETNDSFSIEFMQITTFIIITLFFVFLFIVEDGVIVYQISKKRIFEENGYQNDIIKQRITKNLKIIAFLELFSFILLVSIDIMMFFPIMGGFDIESEKYLLCCIVIAFMCFLIVIVMFIIIQVILYLVYYDVSEKHINKKSLR